MPHAIHVLMVLLPYLLLPLAGWLGGRGRRARLLALAPAALTAYYAGLLIRVATNGAATVTMPWAPRLGLSLSFRFDGLGLLFALLVTGMGTLVVLYAADYLGGHPLAARFQVTLFAFMGSMLGVVLSDNVLLLFVFWELTGFTSYFLIAFDHERPQARRAALQALIVTGGGGLALLAGGVLLWQAGGTPSLSALTQAGSLATDPRYGALVLLVLLAAFTKSAQFPFHFWLPNAMEAPTPVSAYLHSATMVKAGVYLVARMTPLLGGTPLWYGLITGVGAVTMLGAAYRSLVETDLKRILAYTTIAALGAMMMLLGVGTAAAITASLIYLLAHACYKGALFLTAGTLDHQTGSRDVRTLSGLRRAMPATAAAGMLAALSMAGLPPFLGFLAKEQFYASIPAVSPALLLVTAVAASAMLGAAGLRAGVSPFIGSAPQPAETREAGVVLWLAPLVLAILGVVLGAFPGLVEVPLMLASAPVTGVTTPLHLSLWHGFTPVLLLSAVTLAAALMLYRFGPALQRRGWLRSLGTEGIYRVPLAGMDALSRRVGPALQSGPLPGYVRVIVSTLVVLLLATYARSGGLPRLGWRTPARLHEVGLALLIMLGALSAARARSAMGAVLALGTVGYGLALLYVLYGAPDLAATQFAVETLTVVLFVLVFRRLRGFDSGSKRLARVRDTVIAGVSGATIGVLVLVTSSEGSNSGLAQWFLNAALSEGHGRNVVNVILVDFRALDTLGEITVLVTVAIGVRALLRIGKGRVL